MANKKFSEFTLKTDPANVDFVVGYDGTDNVRIDPANIGGGGLTPYAIPTGKNAIYAGFVPTSVTGSQNVVLSGGDTGTNLTTGQDNILIGYRAGVAITTSLNNVCIGSRAGQGLTTIGSGFSNTVIGAEAGGNTSSASTAIGWLAGNRSNTVSVGDQAGRSASGSANLSVHIGSNAGYSNSGSTSVIIGGFAARNNSTDGHTSIGYNAGYSNTSGTNNTNLGYQAGYAVTTGNSNTLIGNNTGAGISTGSGFTVVGKDAGNGATYTGSNVIMLGYDAEASSATVSNEITLGNNNITSFRIPGLQSGASDGDVLTYNASAGKLELQAGGGGGASDLNGLSDCLVDTASLYVGEVPSGLSGNPQDNTVLGIDAGASITSANTCTIIGSNAGNSITTGNRQTIVGHDAGSSITTSGSNTIFGYEAGKGISGFSDRNVVVGDMACRTSAGDDNVAIGSSAGYSWNNAVEDAVAIGSFSSSASSGASGMVAIGRKSARANTSANHISIGYEAGYSNTSGSANTNVGYQAGYNVTTNGSNTNLGYQSMQLSVGSNNTFLGYQAGQGFNASTSTASNNIAIGYKAMMQRRGGNGNNVVIGNDAYKNSDGGYGNVVIGNNAVQVTGSSYNNVAIGKSVSLNSNSDNNSVVIGFSAVGGGSNTVTLGNSSISTLRCAVTSITSLSDERDKTDIKDLGYGLAFIDALQPREFVWNNRPEIRTEYDDDGNETEVEFYSANKGKKDFGFIAQEVKELDNDTLRLVYDENPDKLELSYGKLVPILVQAIKELKEEVELLKS
jgi:hypothetical protein